MRRACIASPLSESDYRPVAGIATAGSLVDILHEIELDGKMSQPNIKTRAESILTLAFVLILLASFGSLAKADNSEVAQIKTVSGKAEIVRNGAHAAAKI